MSGHESADRLVEENVKLVPYLAHKYFKNVPGLSIEDLISAGNLGLWKASQKYDPDHGVKFASFAAKCILNDMRMALRRERKHAQVLSLDAEAYSNTADGSSILLQDLIPSGDDGPEQVVENKSLKENLYAALSELPEKDRWLLSHYYGLGSCEKKSQPRLADELGISQSYVSRKKNVLLNKLAKTIMQESKPKKPKEVKMPTLDLSTFREILPQSKLYLSVTSAQKVSISKQIYNQIGATARLLLGAKGKSVAVLPAKNGAGHKFAKNLYATAPSFYAAVAEEGVSIPARYEMQYIEEQNAWLGTLVLD